MNRYKKFKAVDFLADDYFIKSAVEPAPETDAFWRASLERGEIDEREFVSAMSLVQSFGINKPEVSENRLDAIWSRISTTNGRNAKRPLSRRRSIVVGMVAASLAVAVTLIAVLSDRQAPVDGYISDFAGALVVDDRIPSDKIQVVTGETSIDVEGEEAAVEYDGNEGIKVNAEPVKVKPKAKEQSQVCQLRVPFGKRASLKLADGTMLWLNSGSTVFYPSEFTGDRREIFVDGEIYAEVAHDAQRPFVVGTRAMDITVLGTAFNLSAYRDEADTSLVLVSGSVDVKPKNREVVKVEPNQMFSCTEEDWTVTEVDVESHVSWRHGIYIFQNEQIEKILLRIARYYNVSMNLPASSPGITCSGKLVLKDDLQKLLHGLSQITPMRYVITDNDECFIRFD